jgi:hypothetical protein
VEVVSPANQEYGEIPHSPGPAGETLLIYSFDADGDINDHVM